MGDNKPRVSVIIPCFNHGQYIDEAVGSVLGQTFQEFEIIIVNDGSTDPSTVTKLRNYNYSGCKVIETENRGPAEARNTGIKASTGEYILPLDADDKIGPKYLEEAVKALDNDREIGIVYCGVEFFGDKTGKWDLPDFSVDRILRANMIVCSSLFRRSDYLTANGYNPNMKYGWEDWDFWLSLIEKGKRVYKLPDTHFYYRIINAGSRGSNMEMNQNKRSDSLKTIYLNHIDFYISQTGNPIELYLKLTNILSSKDYRTGRLIVNPFRQIKKRIKKLFINPA